MPEYRRILIIKPSSLGDVVHALPTLAALRDRFPSAHIAWLVKKQWAGILQRAEGLDQIWRVDPGLRGWIRHVPALRATAFDLVIDLQGLFRSGAMAWLTGCRTRIGFAKDARAVRCFIRNEYRSSRVTCMPWIDIGWSPRLSGRYSHARPGISPYANCTRSHRYGARIAGTGWSDFSVFMDRDECVRALEDQTSARRAFRPRSRRDTRRGIGPGRIDRQCR